MVLIHPGELYAHLVTLDSFDHCSCFNPDLLVVFEQEFNLDGLSRIYKRVAPSCFKSCTVKRERCYGHKVLLAKRVPVLSRKPHLFAVIFPAVEKNRKRLAALTLCSNRFIV